MSNRIRIVATVMLASVAMAGASAKTQALADAPVKTQAAATTSQAATAPATAPEGITEPTDLRAFAKPNDNGTAIIVTWRKMPYEAPDVFYELMMDEDHTNLYKRLDTLVAMGVIDAARKAALLKEIGVTGEHSGVFRPQGRMVSQKPKEGAPAAPPCPFQSAIPSAFGFASDNDDYHAVEVTRFLGRKDIVLHIDVQKNRPLYQIKGLFHHVADEKDLDKLNVTAESTPGPVERGRTYFFKLNVSRDGAVLAGRTIVSATPVDHWFAWHKLNLLIAMVVLGSIVMAYAKIAKRNPEKLFIRRIGGLEAVDEALGRAAEMGKPVFFCHGPGDLSSVVTISAINMLGKIAERVAELGAEMKVTCLDYLVTQVSQEMVRDGYTRVGRPDAYKDDNVLFVTGDTFAYSAAVGGMMIRERAGTAFFFGRFGSESLLLSETGAITKAIQIAGTDAFTQIPFFITTCDYTLIGEEMYAASAYLSREPRLVGAVKGQDVVKAITMTAIVAGTVLASLGVWWFAHLFWPLI